MRLLADENVDRPIVRWLRQHGHDVLETVVEMPGAADAEVLRLSRRQRRVLLTFDRDIGHQLRLDRGPHPGVVYLRLRGPGPELWDAFFAVWPMIEPLVAGHFVTVQRNRIRRRSLPMVGDS